LNFLVRQIENEVFTYDERRPQAIEYQNSGIDVFPYILVNIGSGVSIIKVTSNETYERISGTSLGGGTLWGLLGLLTDAADYEEMLALSKKGDNKNVDMLVGDIYGGFLSLILVVIAKSV
jgi:pantothenate kinase